MAIEIQAPNARSTEKFSIFLAGAIDQNAAEDWQSKIVEGLADFDVELWNPRRDDWDDSWEQTAENEKFREQVEWEQDGLDQADYRVFVMLDESKAPITLMELGQHLEDPGAICCEEDFYRKGNVEISAERDDMPLFESVDALIEHLKTMLEAKGLRTDDTKTAAAASVTDNPAFLAWFRNSVIVNPDGSPRVVYHGTDADFDIFNTDSHFGTPAAARSRMEWRKKFKGEKSLAVPGARTMPCYIRMEEPYEMTDKEANDDAVLNQSVKKGMHPELEGDAWPPMMSSREALKRLGYDGIIYANEFEGGSSLIIFSPDQVKSATGNNGEFDPKSRSITSSAPDKDKLAMAKIPAHLASLDFYHGTSSPEAIKSIMTLGLVPNFQAVWKGNGASVEGRTYLTTDIAKALAYAFIGGGNRERYICVVPGSRLVEDVVVDEDVITQAAEQIMDPDEDTPVMPTPEGFDTLVYALWEEGVIAEDTPPGKILLERMSDDMKLAWLMISPDWASIAYGGIVHPASFWRFPANASKSFEDAVELDPATFDPKNKSITAAVTPALKAWFRNSVVKDAQGNPLIVYRGEHGQPGHEEFHSREPSLSFGGPETASQYAESPNNRADKTHSPRVYPCYLRIEKPIMNDPDDPFMDLGLLVEAVGMDIAIQAAIKHEGHIVETNNWDENFSGEYSSVKELLDEKPEAIRELYMNAFPLLADPDVVSALKSKGYDGAIHGGYGSGNDECEYKVFDPSQVKSAIGNNGEFAEGKSTTASVSADMTDSKTADFVSKLNKDVDVRADFRSKDSSRPDTYIYRALIEGEGIGYLMVYDRGNHNAQIRWVDVENQYRHKGVGGLLYTHAIADLRSKGFKRLYSDYSRSEDSRAIWEKYLPSKYTVQSEQAPRGGSVSYITLTQGGADLHNDEVFSEGKSTTVSAAKDIPWQEVYAHVKKTNPERHRHTERDAFAAMEKPKYFQWHKETIKPNDPRITELTPASEKDVRAYGEKFQQGSPFPTIVLTVSSDGSFKVQDGAHRLAAAITKGLPIDAYVGVDPRDAEIKSMTAAAEDTPTLPVTETTAFKAWFGASKIVDDEGNPQIMYRGTQNPGAANHKGSGPVFVSPNRSFAEHYARGGEPYALYVKAEKPFDASYGPGLELWRQHVAEVNPPHYASSGTDQGTLPFWTYEHTIRKWLDEKGVAYDAIWIAESNWTASLAVNDISQLKSADQNSGAFDPADRSITATALRPSSKQASLSMDDYYQGYCHLFALALHEELGFDIGVIADQDGLTHAFGIRPDGSLVDASGTITPYQASNDHGGYGESDIRKISPKALRRKANPEEWGSISEADITKAREWIRDNPDVYLHGVRSVDVDDDGELDWESKRGSAVSPLPISTRSAPTTPGFRAWFNGSKVTNADGQPLIVYKGMMGTTTDTVYNGRGDLLSGDPNKRSPIDHIERQTPFPMFEMETEEPVHLAGFFAEDPNVAAHFAKLFGRGGENGAVFPCYLSIKNPFVIDANGQGAGTVQFGSGGRPFRDAIRSGKYDGVCIRNTSDEGTIWVALKPTQIKSATGNGGDFDSTNKNLVASARPKLLRPVKQAATKWFHGTSKANAKLIEADGEIRPGMAANKGPAPQPGAVYVTSDLAIASHYADGGVVFEVDVTDGQMIPDEDSLGELLEFQELAGNDHYYGEVFDMWWNLGEMDPNYKGDRRAAMEHLFQKIYTPLWFNSLKKLARVIAKTKPELAAQIIREGGKAAHIGPVRAIKIVRGTKVAERKCSCGHPASWHTHPPDFGCDGEKDGCGCKGLDIPSKKAALPSVNDWWDNLETWERRPILRGFPGGWNALTDDQRIIVQEAYQKVTTGKSFTATRKIASAEDITHLKDYLNMTDVEKGEELARGFNYYFVEFIRNEHSDLEEFLPEDEEDYTEDFSPFVAVLPEFLEEYGPKAMQEDPANAPSYLHMDYRGDVTDEWLIHFTDNAEEIAAGGFTIGMSDPGYLGLTTYHRNDGFQKSSGGYNFAFTLAEFARYFEPGHYGKHAVIFRASGINVHHYGDEENQVIFWGKDATNIVPLESSDSVWSVTSKAGKLLIEDRDIRKVAVWVEANPQAYFGVAKRKAPAKPKLLEQVPRPVMSAEARGVAIGL